MPIGGDLRLGMMTSPVVDRLRKSRRHDNDSRRRHRRDDADDSCSRE
jgi:hypothetical protein